MLVTFYWLGYVTHTCLHTCQFPSYFMDSIWVICASQSACWMILMQKHILQKCWINSDNLHMKSFLASLIHQFHLAFKCLALNIRDFGRHSVWHWLTQWTVLLTHSLPYITLVRWIWIVQMSVSDPGWIRTLHKRKHEAAFWTRFYYIVLIVLTRI